MQILLDLINIIGSVYITIVILRFILQLVRADFYNPISQFIVKATNPLLMPIRKVVPGWKGLDVASIILAILLQFILVLVVRLIPLEAVIPNIGPIMGLVLFQLLASVIGFYQFAILILVIMSWVAPGSNHPGAQLIYQVTDPLLKPIRNLIPSAGGLDFSPMILLLLLWVLGRVIGGTY